MLLLTLCSPTFSVVCGVEGRCSQLILTAAQYLLPPLRIPHLAIRMLLPCLVTMVNAASSASVSSNQEVVSELLGKQFL